MSKGIKASDIFTSEELKAFRTKSDFWGAWQLIHDWGVIALCMLGYVLFPSPVTFAVAFVIIGGRQLGLSILMHEASHSLLFKTRWMNDRFGSWFAAWPLILSLKDYRPRHMKHHRFNRTQADPENYLYTPFPVKKQSMARKIARDLTGIAFLRTNYGIIRGLLQGGGLRAVFGFYGGPVLVLLVLFGVSLVLGRPDLFLLLWVLPMMTVQMFFLRIRNVSEHATVPDLDDPLRNTRTTLANGFERLTFAPHYVNYHIEHHLMPDVPCYRLRDVHKALIDKGHGDAMEIQKGYGAVIALNASG